MKPTNKLHHWVLMASRIAVLAMFAGLVIYALAGCAAFQKAIRTVDNLAEDACILFGTQQPEQFRALVIQARPELADKASAAPNLNVVKTLCSIREIVSPFLQHQQMLQRQTAASLRRPPDLGSGTGADGGADALAP